MDELLLNSKLIAPRTGKRTVARSHLTERLSAGLLVEEVFTRKLTLVSAPAGYGKTTLVAEWICELEVAATWLSLDEHDDDPVHFLAYLSVALSKIDPGFVDKLGEPLSSLEGAQPGTISPFIVKEIEEIGEPFILVLDDYQFLGNPAIHQIVNFILDHQPANFHMVLISREDPMIPISRMRARGQVLEIRQSDLSFSISETREFFDIVGGFELAEEDLVALKRRTEGWPVGLQMAALSMHRVVDKGEFVRSFSGSNRYILDYLFDEVLDRLSRNLQEFLLKTSILDRLCGSLCDAVTGRQDSYRMLQRVEAANLFIIPLDETRTWYRYHRLFADLLRHRLRISGEISEEDLHRRACSWYEENGYPKQAIHSALHCQDWERAIELILHNGDYMLRQGEVATLLSLYNKLPEAEINARPDLCLRYSWPLLLTGQLNEAEAYLNQAELIAANDPSILRELTIARAFIARSRGHDQMTIDLSRQALEFVPEIDASLQSVLSVNLGIANWHRGELNQANEAFRMASTALLRTDNRYARLTTLIFQNRIKAARGQLAAAHEGYLPLVENESPMPILALAYLDLGVLYYEWNRLEQSIEWIKKCISHSEWTRNAEFQVAGHTQFARIRLELGDISAAINALQKADTLIEQHSILPLNQSRNAAIHVQLALAQGDLQRASVWLEDAGENADPHNFYPFLGLAPARFYLAQGLNQEAGIHLDGCLKRAIQAGCGYGEVAVRVMRSLVEENRQKALEILLPALRLGQQEGFVRSFVQGGTPLLPFLNHAVLQGIEPVYVGRINSAIRNSAADGLAGGAMDVEALSEREIEVLRLLEVGLSNQEIADQLAISLGTVKTHVHHIYGKLGVSNRTAACKIGREAGYIT